MCKSCYKLCIELCIDTSTDTSLVIISVTTTVTILTQISNVRLETFSLERHFLHEATHVLPNCNTELDIKKAFLNWIECVDKPMRSIFGQVSCMVTSMVNSMILSMVTRLYKTWKFKT